MNTNGKYMQSFPIPSAVVPLFFSSEQETTIVREPFPPSSRSHDSLNHVCVFELTYLIRHAKVGGVRLRDSNEPVIGSVGRVVAAAVMGVDGRRPPPIIPIIQSTA